MEFVNEGDMEELYQSLDDEIVHYAAEVRKFRVKFASASRIDPISILR